MRLKRPYRASLDQVRISRQGDAAVIEYAQPGVWTTHLKLGPEVQRMTDQEILDRFNAVIDAMERLRDGYEHVAIEIPPGEPQIDYFDQGRQWTPRGAVLRCVIGDGGPGSEPIVHIDEHDLSWEEFGRLLRTHAGWGMRVIFVPDDETHLEPRVEVREPRRNER
ncbi:MAG: DUF7713 domain-containing protein [Actinomycetota bacterium]